ncbi:T9SS type A sorting domain-containing protein [Lewinella sp. W8]|uniref:T9SS type A sorting domain-containing protein n=1 Tax=Lewinella sp. W8 TaxID=2528208 RepID=UPI0010684BA3|nr:T9SS type A sorting domain-containing protein [Lewinella sp. W8]MTB50819.1 T9SS type A sorting domain-containing protein [Lewinella sp. W8]
MRLLILGTLLCLSTAMSAQILNDEINVLWRVTEAFANFDDDFNEEEYTLTFGTSTTAAISNHSLCYFMDGESSASFIPSTITNSVNTNVPFTSEFYIGLRAWEDDGGERCTYDDGDDVFYLGLARISGETVPGTGRSSRWLTNTGNQGAECVGDALLPPISNLYNFCYRVIWRHVNGNTFNDPLAFGNIVSLGQRNHFNSNRQTAEPTGVPEATQYGNQYGDPSPDVYYVFSIDEDRENVVISTDHDYTDFDTRLYLLDANGDLLVENDDVSGNNRKSRIERSLCAGTYYVVVEGFDVERGDFQLSVEASGFLAPVEATATITNASCDGEIDGVISVNASDGVAPYTYRLFNAELESLGSFNQTIDNLSANTTYFYQVVDACGQTTSAQSFTVGVTDTEDPVAVCVGATITLPDGTVDSPFSASEISQLGARSTDNCGVTDVELFPNVISASAGDTLFAYELIVYDGMGNSDSEICFINLIVTTTSVTQLPALDAALTAYPNPTSSALTVSIEDFPISTGVLSIRDLQGRTIIQRSLNHTGPNWSAQLDLATYPAGIYTLQVTTPEGQLTRRIVRQ